MKENNPDNKELNVNMSEKTTKSPKTVTAPSIPLPTRNIVTLNVSGQKFQTYAETLERYPDTLLGDKKRRQPFYNAQNGEYFFDRHRSAFASILYFYQSHGYMKRPESIPIEIYVKELMFFQMDCEVMEIFWRSEGFVKPEPILLPKNPCISALWQIMEYPNSSIWAKLMALFSVFVIAVSTISFCLETIPELRTRSRKISTHSTKSAPMREDSYTNDSWTLNDTLWTISDTAVPMDWLEISRMDFKNYFFIIEFTCICWFTIEFLTRIVICPSKWKFCINILNIIDFVAIAPFYITLAISANEAAPFAVLRILRLFRVFRLFKLSRFSKGLQILVKTFRASVKEFGMLGFFLILLLTLFSSAIYFAETAIPDTQFKSIPETFWFCIVTMTTVGFGDMVPKGPWGKFIGSFCAIFGVVVLALPVPVIVSNFERFFKQENALQLKRKLEGDTTPRSNEF